MTNELHKNMDPPHDEYWKKAKEAADKVSKWPAWKRNIQIGSIGAEKNPGVRVSYIEDRDYRSA